MVWLVEGRVLWSVMGGNGGCEDVGGLLTKPRSGCPGMSTLEASLRFTESLKDNWDGTDGGVGVGGLVCTRGDSDDEDKHVSEAMVLPGEDETEEDGDWSSESWMNGTLEVEDSRTVVVEE